MIEMMSIGMPASDCMLVAPLRRMPNRRRPAQRPADGSCRAGPARWSRSRNRPRSPARPSGPCPAPALAPASPASAPLRVITSTKLRMTLMPAYLAASGLAPTARISKPKRGLEQEPVDQAGNNQRQQKPQLKRSGSGKKRGSSAVASMLGVTGRKPLSLHRAVEQPVAQAECDLVHHDGVDHFVRAELGLQIARDRAPDGAGQRTAQQWPAAGG